ncbi:MAG: DnaJ domain-containing protein [Benjaminiella poitrasii]|nr:MAG: DnaJ domain-containing protein [Benjaminiella poitrasii]
MLSEQNKMGSLNDEETKYKLVRSILASTNYYEVLDLTEDSTTDEIRKTYIKKSKVCHPDKFGPAYPPATESFQLLSIAYHVLGDPSRRYDYDFNRRYGLYCSSREANMADICQELVIQLYDEFVKGEFNTLHSMIHSVNNSNSFIHINDELLDTTEIGIIKMRDLFYDLQNYFRVFRSELGRLSEIRQEMRRLSYLDIKGRVSLSAAFIKILIQMPSLITQQAIQQQEILSTDAGDRLHLQLELLENMQL